nr:TIM barrel protein [Cytophagales bacterium]
MIFSMSNIAWTPNERLQAYKALAEADAKGLEIAPGIFFHAAADPFLPDENVARSAVKEIEEFGLSLVSMQSLLFGVDDAHLFGDIEQRRSFKHAMIRAINLAERFHIPNLVFGSPKQRRIPDDMTQDQAKNEAAEMFRSLGDIAQKAGTKISMEANPEIYGTNFLNTLDAVCNFVSFVNHPAVTTVLDIGAMHINQDLDFDLKTIPSLHHVHISEPNLMPAPQDIAALTKILRSLDEIGYDEAVSIEMKLAPEGIKVVRASLDKLNTARKNIGIPNAG